jgi:hypothetical protein
MGQPVVHFEIIGANPEKLRSYYCDLYVGVPDVEDALRDAQRPGGTRRMGPA